MADENLSDRERLLLETARREVAVRKAAQTVPGSEGEPRASSSAAPGTAGAGFAGTPLDASTVFGWDHPAARVEPVRSRADAHVPAGRSLSASASPSTPLAARTTAIGGERDRWARAADLLKAERMAEEARRERLRRNGLGAIAALLLVMLAIAFATVLPHLPR